MSESGAARNIGLGGAVFTLVGYVIGASIFILPGALAADVGPGAFLSYLIAGVLAALTCVVGAELGSTVPVSGAINVTASRVLGPAFGFLGVWALIMGVSLAIALVASGFADYFAYFVPGADRTVVALATAIGFGVINLTTVRLTVGVQTVMTVVFLLILLLFGIGGAATARPELLTPFLPRGWGAVVGAAVPAFFSYAGVMVITELGGEIRDPARTIPRALLLAFLLVAFCYGLVAFAVPAQVPWRELSSVSAPIAYAAERFLPRWMGGVIAFGALLAAATSINGMVLIHSRDVLAMARASVFPAVFARRAANGVPLAAVALIAGGGVLCVLPGGSIRELAITSVISIMIIQMLAAASVLLLPSRLPEEHARSGFRLRPVVRWVVVWVVLLASAGFIALAVGQGPRNAALYLAVLLLGGVYYYLRRAVLARRGQSLDDILRSGATAEG